MRQQQNLILNLVVWVLWLAIIAAWPLPPPPMVCVTPPTYTRVVPCSSLR